MDYLTITGKTKYRWPYIDIFFWREINGYIRDESKGWRSVFNYKKEDVFPLTLRPFHGALLPVPCKTEKLLTFMHPEKCSIHQKLHKMHAKMPRHLRKKPVACTNFHEFFPFIRQRLVTESFIYEERVEPEQHTKSFVFSAKCDWAGGNEKGDRRHINNRIKHEAVNTRKIRAQNKQIKTNDEK